MSPTFLYFACAEGTKTTLATHTSHPRTYSPRAPRVIGFGGCAHTHTTDSHMCIYIYIRSCAKKKKSKRKKRPYSPVIRVCPLLSDRRNYHRGIIRAHARPQNDATQPPGISASRRSLRPRTFTRARARASRLCFCIRVEMHTRGRVYRYLCVRAFVLLLVPTCHLMRALAGKRRCDFVSVSTGMTVIGPAPKVPCLALVICCRVCCVFHVLYVICGGLLLTREFCR